jgi:CubicO group peptidase (beta-lactamase class C family)
MLVALRMRSFSVLALALALLPACAAAPPPAPPTALAGDARSAAVDGLFARWARPGSPGCSVAVSAGGRVAHARGYGLADLEHDVALSPGTSFHVASVSKQFTAFAVLLLEGEGRLSLDDDIRRHVPEVPTFGGARITLRHLLHHTSGLRDYLGMLRLGGFRPDDVITEADVLDVVARQEALNFPPGAEHLYSNTGYALLALVVRRVTGAPLGAYAAARLFGPLGLAGTHFHADHAALVPGRARGYERGPEDVFHASEPVFDTVGSTGLHSTALDLVRWSDALAAGRAGPSAVSAAMIRPGHLADGTALGYAAGLMVGSYRGLATVDHAGADAGFRAELLRFPAEKLAIAVLCNVAEARPVELARAIADIYLEGRLGPRPEAPAAAPDPARAGLYLDAQRDEVTRVSLRKHELVISGAPLVPLAGDRFRLGNAEVTFRAGALVRTVPGQRPVVFDRVTPAHPGAADLAPLAGDYDSPELATRYTLAVAPDGLVVRPRRLGEHRLVPLGADVFVDDDGRVLRVQRGEGGRVTGFTLSTARVRRVRFERR